jgi:hypothetical protein
VMEMSSVVYAISNYQVAAGFCNRVTTFAASPVTIPRSYRFSSAFFAP